MTEQSPVNVDAVKTYLLELQDHICEQLVAEETSEHRFITDSWERDGEEGSMGLTGGGRSRVLEQGEVIEKGGVNFSHVRGKTLPVSATAHRPELAGRSFQALGVSLVIHPRNPYAPTSHANVRMFIAEKAGEPPVWWFGGGFDLTPFYPVDEDVIHWHQQAKQACDPFGETVYVDYKTWCDEYFYLKHRQETRGVGGLFFDDLNAPGFEQSFALMRSIGDHYIKAYRPILAKRKAMTYGEREREFQLYRRGRYAEFNLVFDRGTLFGLQTGGRTESILMSMPPLVTWKYNYQPDAGSAEAKLSDYLVARDWLGQAS